jgi:hypothetical protein
MNNNFDYICKTSRWKTHSPLDQFNGSHL